MNDRSVPPRIRILFVDDESRLLDGIVRMLRPMRATWDVRTAIDGQTALAMLEAEPFDLIVSDMRMPGMSGAQLLKEVASRHPQVVRYILTGQADRASLMQAIETTHRFLAKPCDAEALRHDIERSLRLRSLLRSQDLAREIGRIGALPTLPELYVAICSELSSPNPSMSEIARIVERDIGLTAKVMQLANAAGFCGTVRVVAPVDAVSRLGLDIIRSLVLAEHVFGSCTAIDWQSERWWSHSMAIAHAARAIARCEQANHDLSVSCFTAGLLHDCGHLLMPRDDAGEAIDAGSMHAEIGAYLLGLWGLPDAVVETVAWHHAPGQGGATAFNPLMAVHVAQHLVVPAQSEDPTTLDAEWLTACGMHGRIEAWRAAVAEDAASA